jgi:hypothetical protein
MKSCSSAFFFSTPRLWLVFNSQLPLSMFYFRLCDYFAFLHRSFNPEGAAREAEYRHATDLYHASSCRRQRVGRYL